MTPTATNPTRCTSGFLHLPQIPGSLLQRYCRIKPSLPHVSHGMDRQTPALCPKLRGPCICRRRTRDGTGCRWDQAQNSRRPGDGLPPVQQRRASWCTEATRPAMRGSVTCTCWTSTRYSCRGSEHRASQYFGRIDDRPAVCDLGIGAKRWQCSRHLEVSQPGAGHLESHSAHGYNTTSRAIGVAFRTDSKPLPSLLKSWVSTALEYI